MDKDARNRKHSHCHTNPAGFRGRKKKKNIYIYIYIVVLRYISPKMNDRLQLTGRSKSKRLTNRTSSSPAALNRTDSNRKRTDGKMNLPVKQKHGKRVTIA